MIIRKPTPKRINYDAWIGADKRYDRSHQASDWIGVTTGGGKRDVNGDMRAAKSLNVYTK